MLTSKKLINKLPDAYRKDETSNNYKLLDLAETEITALREDIQKTTLITDLANSSGKTLDLFGDMLGKKRGTLDDDKYRYVLQSQVAQNIVAGDFNSVLNALVSAFSLQAGDATYSDIKIEELPTSGNVKITKLPLKVLNRAGLTTDQTKTLIQDILPIGVAVTSIGYEGTFEFCAQEYEYDNNKGFGSIDTPDIGGALGGLMSIS